MKSNYRLSYENRINTGTLLLLSPPKKMNFGIDLSEWTIGDKFLGIKLIPLGVHIITFSLENEKYNQKQFFFISIKKEKLNIIRKWSEEYQFFIPLNEEDDKNFSIGLNNFDFEENLGEYPFDQKNNWNDLSKFISFNVINKLQPISKKYFSIDKEYDNNNKIEIKDNVYYSDIPKKIFNIGNLKKKELSEINIDKTKSLELLIEKEYNNNFDDFLGEFQYSFITFLLGESYEGLIQFKDIFCLITSCEDGFLKYEKFFCNFVEVIYNQFRNFPNDLFYDEIIGNNFMKRYLNNFINNINCRNDIPNLKKRIKLFEKFLNEKFNYKIENEEERIINNYLKGIKSYSYNEEIDDDLPIVIEESEIKKFEERINKMNLDS